MRNKVAKRLKRHAEKVTIGMPLAETEKVYNNLKKTFVKTDGSKVRNAFVRNLHTELT